MKNRKPQLPFNSTVALGHHYWKDIVSPGDTVIDATCGNGHDTLVLANLVLTDSSGVVIGIDIQQTAIEKTASLLKSNLDESRYKRVQLLNRCHSTIDSVVEKNIPKLIVYNLGYLPGEDKSIKTMYPTTLTSISKCLDLLDTGGVLSITCYPGHLEGKEEEEKILAFVNGLNPRKWAVLYSRYTNRKLAPSLLLIAAL